MKSFLRSILGLLYRVEVRGIEHLERAGPRVLVVANHTSFLDAILLAVFLPGPLTFAVNTFIARRWWMRPLLALVEHFPMDPTNPLSTKALIKYLRGDRRAAIFPEGRITVTGSLMKIYDGTGLVADRSGAVVVPVRIDGAQYTPFSRLRGRVRLRWFPSVTLTVLAPVMLSPPATVVGRARRKHVGRLLADIMTDMMFATSNTRRSLFEAFVDARRVHGGRHLVVEDIERQPLGYDALLTRCTVIGRALAPSTTPGERVALLLPSTVNAVAVFMGLQAIGRVPAMLNYTIGSRGLLSACETARIRTVLTSRRFITAPSSRRWWPGSKSVCLWFTWKTSRPVSALSTVWRARSSPGYCVRGQACWARAEIRTHRQWCCSPPAPRERPRGWCCRMRTCSPTASSSRRGSTSTHRTSC